MKALAAAILLLIILLGLTLCGGPLTAEDGVKAGDKIHSVLTEYIGGSDPVTELDGIIRPKVIDLVNSNNGKKGVTTFIDSACDRILLLMRNRIRSTPNNGEKSRLRAALPVIQSICEDAKSQAEEPAD